MGELVPIRVHFTTPTVAVRRPDDPPPIDLGEEPPKRQRPSRKVRRAQAALGRRNGAR